MKLTKKVVQLPKEAVPPQTATSTHKKVLEFIVQKRSFHELFIEQYLELQRFIRQKEIAFLAQMTLEFEQLKLGNDEVLVEYKKAAIKRSLQCTNQIIQQIFNDFLQSIGEEKSTELVSGLKSFYNKNTKYHE